MYGRTLGTMAAAVLVACGGPAPVMMGNDAGITIPTDSGVMCANHIPNPDPNIANPMYGTLMGRSFQEFSVMGPTGPVATPLVDCDGHPHYFYGEQYCSATHRFTVVSIAAGWCNPCMAESMLITDQLVNRYGSRGVRVIQVLVQDANHLAPTQAFCRQWASTFGLSIAPNAAGVGSYELIDPQGITNEYFPDGYLPSTLIIDNQGVIRFHEDGLDAQNGMLTSIVGQLDRLLAGP